MGRSWGHGCFWQRPIGGELDHVRGLGRTGLALLGVLLMILPSPGVLGDDLSTFDVAAISLGSVALMGLGAWASHGSADRHHRLNRPLLLDGAVQGLVVGDCLDDRTNFLNNTRGSIYTPVAGGALLMVADLTHPQDGRSRLAGQDIFLYSSGLVACKGLSSIAKGLTCRPRPRIHSGRPDQEDKEWNRSFFSGHAVSAFFSTAFLNLRTRYLMRSEMNSDEYRRWRFGPPVVLFGWASYVGLSRIQACEHYFSDVVVGAAVGILMAELFYSFDKANNKENNETTQSSNETSRIVTLSFSF